MFEFKLPDLGEGVHEGELLKWYVEEGDVVKEDDPLLDVETDKAAVTIPSPRTGRIVKRNGEVGDTLHVGQVIVVIDDQAAAGAEAPAREEAPQAPEPVRAPEPAPPRREPAAARVAAPPQPAPVAAERRNGPVPAAPATRRLARELGIDLREVPGSGPGGRVTMEDVRAFAARRGPAAPAAAPGDGQPATAPAPPGPVGIPLLEIEPLPDFAEFGPVEKEPLRSIRRKVAVKMVTSMVLVPHVVHMDEADVTELEELRLRERERTGKKITPMAFVMKALLPCLKKFPMFNASLDPFRGEIIYKKYYNFGFAADTERGLVVPVLKEVDKKSIEEISDEIAALAARARDGSIGVEDFRGGTFTVTNIGSLGGTGLIPTINYPEVAILGMARVQERPVVREGAVVVRKILPLTLSFDHRIADGADAARFMNELVACLSSPAALLMRL